jgi:hypothetical protein
MDTHRRGIASREHGVMSRQPVVGGRGVKPVNVSPSKPIDGGRVVYAADQPEYLSLPSWKRQGPDGRVVSRWRLTWRERLAALFGRDLYIEVLTFDHPLQPIFLTFSEREMFWPLGADE